MTPEEEKERALWRQQKHLELKAELQQNEKLKQFLENVYPTSREGFIDSYALEKVRWLEWGPKYIEWLEREDLKWVNDATGRLREIQQKKLFDLQCKWRAEKVELEDIVVSYDFRQWEFNILNCPYIEPVTEEEVDLYIQYLQSENFENEQGFLDSWQDYDGIKRAYNENNASRNFPDWYDFHNSRTGASYHLLFPDIRGQKEEDYLSLWRIENRQKAEEKKKEEEKNNKAQAEEKKPVETAAKSNEAVSADTSNTKQEEQPHDSRPSLNYFQEGWMTWFVTTYEDKETKRAFEQYGGERPFKDYDEHLEEDLRLLGRADRIMPVMGWFDWKEAIHKAADKYRREKIAEALPLAYEHYRMTVDLGIKFEDPKREHRVFQPDWYREAILRGRELNGEPRDFNF